MTAGATQFEDDGVVSASVHATCAADGGVVAVLPTPPPRRSVSLTPGLRVNFGDACCVALSHTPLSTDEEDDDTAILMAPVVFPEDAEHAPSTLLVKKALLKSRAKVAATVRAFLRCWGQWCCTWHLPCAARVTMEGIWTRFNKC